ncbi:MAG: hypothetical protein WCR63_04115 [Bacilli bacterium]
MKCLRNSVTQFGFLLVFGCFLVVSCSTLNNTSSSSDSNYSQNNSDSDAIEGGNNGKVRGYFQFNDYDVFALFYSQFKEKNHERYLVPPDSNANLKFDYSFLSEGITKKDYEEKTMTFFSPTKRCM